MYRTLEAARGINKKHEEHEESKAGHTSNHRTPYHLLSDHLSAQQKPRPHPVHGFPPPPPGPPSAFAFAFEFLLPFGRPRGRFAGCPSAARSSAGRFAAAPPPVPLLPPPAPALALGPWPWPFAASDWRRRALRYLFRAKQSIRGKGWVWIGGTGGSGSKAEVERVGRERDREKSVDQHGDHEKKVYCWRVRLRILLGILYMRRYWRWREYMDVPSSSGLSSEAWGRLRM